MRPELMVSGCPDDGAEPLPQLAQGPFDVAEQVTHVAGHDEPVVVRLRAQAIDDLPVLGVRHVQIAGREQ
jgi:hypothetical protein